jgi:anti-anti-sigma regulatory factor
MNIEIVDYKGKQVISLSGDIDMYSSPILREKLLNLVKRKIPTLFVDKFSDSVDASVSASEFEQI